MRVNRVLVMTPWRLPADYIADLSLYKSIADHSR
jgi:hypothetical protein